jgi:hypothetical protein
VGALPVRAAPCQQDRRLPDRSQLGDRDDHRLPAVPREPGSDHVPHAAGRRGLRTGVGADRSDRHQGAGAEARYGNVPDERPQRASDRPAARPDLRRFGHHGPPPSRSQ